ncbi:MAG: DUF4838 domain-containing protein [Chitinophagaceae bacterium]
MLQGLFYSCTTQPESIDFLNEKFSKRVIVIPQKATESELKAAQWIQYAIHQATNFQLDIVRENNKPFTHTTFISIGNTKQASLLQHKSEIVFDGFHIIAQQDNIYFESQTASGILNSVIYFSKQFLNFYCIDGKFQANKLKEILLPSDYQLSSSPDFAYREVYFNHALLDSFATCHSTHQLENEWGIWGHNLFKKISDETKQNETIYALVNNQRTYDQLCFSSTSLLENTKQIIQNSIQENPQAKYFSIMPLDNSMACVCAACTAKGNSSEDATPAVWEFIKHLCVSFPSQQFFGSYYASTKKIPQTALPANAGVLLSTIDLPKGISISNQKNKTQTASLFKQWKGKTEHVFVWDYAVNFANYFSFFPVLKTLQEDLKWYKKMGVEGVFIHGNETEYSMLEEIKTHVIASLLWNTNANIDSLRYEAFGIYFPSSVEEMNEYYENMENSVVQNRKALSIYGGAEQATQYLQMEQSDLFFYDMIEKVKTLNGFEKTHTQKLLLALSYITLEQLRTKGASAGGYLNKTSNGFEINKEVEILLTQLSELAAVLNINTINESQYSIQEYIRQWHQYSIEQPYENKWINQPYVYRSTPDEEFISKCKTMLTDGAIGFLDYENNWLIATNHDMLIDIKPVALTPKALLSFQFLSDPKHHIYFPSEIIISQKINNEERIIASIKIKNTEKQLPEKRKENLFITNFDTNKELTISIIRNHSNQPKVAIACDEIYLLNAQD